MFLAFFAFLALLSPLPPPELFRALDLEGAVAAAKAERKYVLAVFTSAGSSDSKKLDMTTWTETKVREWMTLKAVPIKLDTAKNDDVALKLRIHTTPTIVFLDDTGHEIDRITGYVDGRVFLEEMKSIFGERDALARAKRRLADEPNDPHRRIDVAIALVDRGEFEAALEQLAWCWDQGLAADPSFAECRRTFLLREVMRLARIHPKAADMLAARARAAYDRVVTCTAPESDIADLLVLDHELQQEERTLAAYDALDAASEQCAALRARLGPLIVDPLIDARRYEEAIAHIGDPRALFNRMVADFRAESERLKRDHPKEAFVAIDTNRRALRNRSARVYEALLGAKRYDDAESFTKLVLLFDGSGATHCALIVAALRIEAHGQAKALAAKALADPRLSSSEKEDVRKLASAIITPK
jgi:thioredoxin-related protein